MFQDALIESSGRLRSASRYWMLATLALNLAIVAALILIPLLHPAALPRTVLSATLTAPPLPPAAKRSAPVQVAHATRAVASLNPMVAPARVPHHIDLTREPAPAVTTGVMSGAVAPSDIGAGTVLAAMGTAATPVVVPRETPPPSKPHRIAVSSGVAAGALLNRTQPVYPAIAKAARVSGPVLLHAVISRSGSIESLQVVSGPEMLRASALDAVRQWRYRPYLLNGEPTEVETSITVNFTFGG